MAMWVVSRRKIREFSETYPQSEASLLKWFDTVRHASWRSPQDVVQTFNRADVYGRCSIFNISGGVRLIAAIHFNTGKVFIRKILTHAEYDKGQWRNECEG